MTVIAIGHTSAGGRPWILRNFWPVLAAFFVLRLIIGASVELTPDEAVYWSWSRHLALGYLDHPPMIAWINWLSTRLFGSTQFAVRLPAAAMALGSLAIIFRLARRLMPDEAAAYVAWMWLLGPLLMVIATISTPDTPAMFFSTLGLACVVSIVSRKPEVFRGTGFQPVSSYDTRVENPCHNMPDFCLWLLFGLFSGLAFLSKYTTVLLPAGIVLALLTSPVGRVHFRRPGIYAAAALALLIFSPVLWWNEHHGWASFAYQFRHGAGTDEPVQEGATGVSAGKMLMHLAAYIGGQAVTWTPILFGVTVVVMANGWKSWRRLDEVDRILLCCATLPLVLFGLASMRKLGEMNWPMFAYVPASLMIGRYLAARPTASAAKWVWEGCKIALAFTLALHLLLLPGATRVLNRLHVHVPHNLLDVTDRWRRFGRGLGRVANGLPVVCNRHQDAAEASFYMPDQPDVWCDSVASRPTAYDFFDRSPDFAKMSRLIFVGGHVPQFAAKHGYLHWQTLDLGTADADGNGARTADLMWR